MVAYSFSKLLVKISLIGHGSDTGLFLQEIILRIGHIFLFLSFAPGIHECFSFVWLL